MIHKINQNPSFSSTLLDQIYRSISENDDDLKFYNDTMPTNNKKKQSKVVEDDNDRRRRRPSPVDKWIDHKVAGEHNIHQKPAKKSLYDHDLDQDSMFFSSTSISSDSSSGSGGFSFSDTDSINATKSKSKSSSYSSLPNRPKPVRTTVNKTEKKSALFYSQREFEIFGDFHSHYNSSTDLTPKINDTVFKSKSRALKIYNKVKQPISPGGKLVNFINSIFASGNSKKSKNVTSNSVDEERKFKSGQASSTCSSASSFSRSCLSKSEKFRDRVKRNVRFYPVSVIVDEDCRPCGQKSLYQDKDEEESSGFMSVSLPTAWKIGSKKSDNNEFKFQVMDHNKSRRVEQVARDLLREYKKKNDSQIMRTDHLLKRVDDDDEDDDDVSSCASSDLFELDHLSVIGKDRYCEELPVYETTRIETNRAIANGFRM